MRRALEVRYHCNIHYSGGASAKQNYDRTNRG
jgi:hypothetical protein